MRIALLTPQWSGTTGGPSKYVAALDKELRALGHNVTVITTDAGAGATTIKGRTPVRDWQLFQALRQAAPDIVHVHGRAHMIPAAVLYRTTQSAARIVFTFHTQPVIESYLPGLAATRPSYSKPARPLVRMLLRQCDMVTAVAQSIVANLNTSYGLKIGSFQTVPSGGYPHVIDGIDLEKFRTFSGVGGRFPVLSSIGVFSWDWKVLGHKVCIDAVPLLLALYPRVLLLIAGDGQYRQYLEEYVRARGLDSHVRFLGNVPNSALLLGVTDVYLHMAMHEGCSLALIEAMFAEKPIIAARRGGNPEVVQDAISARLIEPEPTTLAETVNELVADEKRRTTIAATARATALRAFAWPVVARRYEALYSRVLGARGSQ